MDEVVDTFFDRIHLNMEVELAEWLGAVDQFTRRMLHATKSIPPSIDGMIERTIRRSDMFDGLCTDQLESIKMIFQIGVPVGILLNAEDLEEYFPEVDEEIAMCDDIAIRVVDACMSRIRAGSIHEEIRQKILKRDHAVRIIQRTWRRVIACPAHQVCRNRLVREIAEMETD